MSAEKLIAKSELCSGGGIGRRVWLRSIWCKPWGFKSPLEYHLFLYDVCAYIAQLVEHILGKDEVTSSTLVSSSKELLQLTDKNRLRVTALFLLKINVDDVEIAVSVSVSKNIKMITSRLKRYSRKILSHRALP